MGTSLDPTEDELLELEENEEKEEELVIAGEEEEVVVAEEYEYQDERLRDRTPAEIETMFGLMDDTIVAQRGELNKPVVTAPEEEEDDRFLTEKFLEEPGDFIDKRIRATMDEVVAPLRTYVDETRQEQVLAAARKKFKHFVKLESIILQLAERQGTDLTNPNDVSYLYYATVGWSEDKGINLDEGKKKPKPVTPQHKPDGSRPPVETGDEVEELTEQERRMAREWDMTDEEFIKMGSRDPEDVLEPDEEG